MKHQNILSAIITLVLFAGCDAVAPDTAKSAAQLMSLEPGQNSGPVVEAPDPAEETIAVTGYVVYLETYNDYVILAEDGKKYAFSFSDQSLAAWPYFCRRVAVTAVAAGAPADTESPAPVTIQSIRIDSSEDDFIIRGRVTGATDTSVAITGDDGTRYRAEAPKEYISLMRATDFWSVYAQARVLPDIDRLPDGGIPVTIVYHKLDGDALVSKTGTVKFNTLEGGFWCIMGDDGKGYDMSNLPEEYQIEGLRVKFIAKSSDRCVNYHMWGFCIELADISPLNQCSGAY